jgi:Phosphate-induced protein 1 conserved region/PKD domain
VTNLPSFSIAPSRLRSKIAVLIAVMTCGLLWLAAPAGAIVTEVGGTSVGLQPRNGTTLEEGAAKKGEFALFANNNGNVVLHGTNVYAVYWDPGNTYRHEWLVKINQFFQDLGGSSGSLETIFSALGQYRDRSNVPATNKITFKGAYSDTAKYPAAPGCTDPNPLEVGQVICLTDAQLREQLQSFVASHALPKGMNTIYYLMTPPGVTVCVDAAGTRCSDFALTEEEAENGERESVSYKNSFCSYHGAINPNKAEQGDASTILYASIPWTAGYSGMAGFLPTSFPDVQAYDCQDGGWNPAGNEENREEQKTLSAEEIASFEKLSPEKKAIFREEQRLENPHQEEPNQEGKGEFGDFAPGLADLLINQIAVEQANTVTDPMLNGWQDTTKHEVTDECRNVFGNTVGGGVEGSVVADLKTEAGSLSNEAVSGDNYYINNVFSLAKDRCAGGTGLVPRFTAPNPVNANEIVGFDGMESTVGLLEGKGFGPSGPPTTTYATYSWNFGDGTPEVKGFAPGAPTCEAPWLSPCAGSIFHAYAFGGTYAITLTITDVAGNVSNVIHDLVVAGPPAPATAPGGSNPGGQTQTIVNPIAAAAIVSRSLKNALKKGLSVRYSVNEQVAGHFEVLISSALAKKLKLHGSPATGLPAGTPPQLMIAKAVLVTTKAGRNTIRIKFSKTVAARLRHAHKVPLLLRMFVRNAASKSPATTTVLSSVTLTG